MGIKTRMDDLTKLVEEVTTKVRFNVRTVRRGNQTKMGGQFEHMRYEIRTESATSVTAAGMRRHYRNGKHGWGTSSQVGITFLGDGREWMGALTSELRSRMRPFVEPSEDIVGHAVSSIRPTGRMSIKTYPSQLVGRQAFSKVSDLTEAFVVAAGCLGADRAIEMLLQWIAGEPLRYRTCVLLPYVTINQTLQADGVRLAELPASVDMLPSSLPLTGSIAVEEFLRAVVLSVETHAGPVFFRPQTGEDREHKVQPTCVLGDERLVMETFCESISLAADDYVRHRWMWSDYGDVTAFGLGEPESCSGPRDAGYSWPKARISRKILKDALKIHRIRTHVCEESRRLETSITRWVKSKDRAPSARRLEDSFIELRIALEALYLDNEQGELSFRLATNGAWDLGSTPSQRESYFKILRQAYNVSSRAIHGGRVNPKESSWRLLRDAQAACRKGILKRLERPGSPDWLRLVLGHKNPTSKT